MTDGGGPAPARGGAAAQRQRRAQESAVVRRLTAGAGTAALGLAGYFSASAATAAPLALAAEPAAAVGQADATTRAEQNDRVFVRRVHVVAPRPPAAGVRPTATPRTGAGQSSTAAQPAAAPPAPAATPQPTPVAVTGGSRPR